MKIFQERVKRSVVKSVTFRLVVLVADTVIVFLITHRYDVSIAIIVFTNLASTILYYLHERIWNKIVWGKHLM